MKLKGLAFILIIILTFPSFTYTRSFKNKQFALFSYEVNISKSFRNRIESIESYINSNFEFNLSADDKFEAILNYIIYNRLQKKLKEDVEIDVLPITSYLHNVRYNDYGYPIAGVQRAIFYGDSHYYFKIQVNIDPFLSKKIVDKLIEKDTTHLIQYKLADNNSVDTIQPEVNIEMSIFNKYGVIPVKKVAGIGYEKGPSEINENFFYGIIPGDAKNSERPDCLSVIIDKAIADLIRKLH